MTFDEKRGYLIRALLSEEPRYQNTAIPGDEARQFDLLRALMNVRPPRPASAEFLAVQDEYLTELSQRRGITDATALPSVPGDPRLVLWQGDITTLKIDGIVNAANSALLGCFHPLHACIDNVIHTYSGVQLRLACQELMERQGHEEPVGQAKITDAYNLPCRYVLHTVGPMIEGPVTTEDERLLAACYRSCLQLAAESGLTSLAFCCISTGVFHFPNERAAEIAAETVRGFLDKDARIRRVVFNVFRDSDLAIYRRLLT